MCNHHRGVRLQDGAAHTRDHTLWSRRDFLSSMGLVAAAGTLGLSGVPVRSFARSGMLSRLAQLETDRVLVILQLSGGNDGLNTVIPRTNDLYFNARPSLGLRDSLPLTDLFGLHPSMTGLAARFSEGEMAVVHAVGYPDPDLSHFRSTDIWMTADQEDAGSLTGWAGRYLDLEFPDYAQAPTEYPLAVQLGGAAPLLFQGPSSQMGMSVQSMDLFDRLATSAQLYSVSGLPDTPQGSEMAFLRSVANDSFHFAEAIQTASAAGSNQAEYTVPNPLADQLAAVARLIRGGLGSRIYHVSLGGFDTHAGQLGTHATLLRYVSEAVSSFLADLAWDGWSDRVLVMSFSEFGRRVQQNGSGGTDHGTAAPLFLFGPSVVGGFHGPAPDLAALQNGNLSHQTDFRSVYASVLTQWFGMDGIDASSLLGGSFPMVDLVTSGTGTSRQSASSPPVSPALSIAYPNPASTVATFRVSGFEGAPLYLDLIDIQGRRVLRMDASAYTRPGSELPVNVAELPSGRYMARLTDGTRSVHSALIVAH